MVTRLLSVGLLLSLAEAAEFDTIREQWGEIAMRVAYTWVWNFSQTLAFSPKLFQACRARPVVRGSGLGSVPCAARRRPRF